MPLAASCTWWLESMRVPNEVDKSLFRSELDDDVEMASASSYTFEPHYSLGVHLRRCPTKSSLVLWS